MSKTIEIYYHTDAIDKLTNIGGGKSDWIDLRAAEDYVLEPGDFKLINLGVSVKLPAGYEAHLVPRSSTFKNWGIIQTNSMGVIDNSYCGKDDIWMMPVYATRHTVIHTNDRVCQFRIVKRQEDVTFNEVSVDDFDEQSRGGFGSTGVN